MFKKIIAALTLAVASLVYSQQPQANDLPPTQPIYATNAKLVNGVAPGYWPTAASTGLTLNVSAGTSFFGSTYRTDGAQTITMVNGTNYVYLNSTTGALASSTSNFTSGQFPIAVVVASGGNITSILDVRTMFSDIGTGVAGVTLLNGLNGSINLQSTDGSVIITPSPGLINLQAASTGGGTIPSNAIFVFTGTSINDDDLGVLAPHVAVNSWTQTGTVVSFVNSGTNNFSAGDWINTRFLTGWSFGAPTGVFFGTGYNIFKVLSTGLSGTTFQIDIGTLTESPCSSSCGYAESAMGYAPFMTTNRATFPSGAVSRTYTAIPNPVTIPGAASNYTVNYHALSPAANGGRPAYLIINDHGNDDQLCTATATVQAAYKSLFAQAHADGYIVVVGAGVSQQGFNQTIGCATAWQLWNYNRQALFGMYKTVANAASGQYWDIIVDTSTPTMDGTDPSNQPQQTGSQRRVADANAAAINDGAGTPVNYQPWVWAAPPGSSVAGYTWAGSLSDPIFDFRSPDLGTINAEIHAGGMYVPTLRVFNGNAICPSFAPFCVTGAMYVDASGNLISAGLRATAIAAASGHSCLHIDTAGNITNTGPDCNTGGSSAWSALTNPTGNLSLAMGADTSLFTYNAATGSSDLFGLTDTTSNTGTGVLFHVYTASGSTEIPFKADANGCGWEVNASGAFVSTCTTSSTQMNMTYSTGFAPVVGSATTTVYAVDASGNAEVSNAGAAFSLICTQSTGCPGSGSTAWSAIASGTNTNALNIGTGGSFGPTGTGIVNANEVNGATVAANLSSLATDVSGHIVLGSGGGGSTVPAFVQGTNVGLTTPSSASITSPAITLAANHTVVVFCRSGSTRTFTVSSTPTLSWNQNTGIAGGSQSTGSAWAATSAGSTTFTCTPNSADTFMSMTVVEYSLASPTTNLTPTTNGIGTGTSYMTSASTTTTQRTFVVFCGGWADQQGRFPGMIAGNLAHLDWSDQGVGPSIATNACESYAVPAAGTFIGGMGNSWPYTNSGGIGQNVIMAFNY